MLRSLICAVLSLALFTFAVLAAEYKGKVVSVDPDKNTITVDVDGKEKTLKVADNAEFKAGKRALKGGLKAKQFGKGPNVVVRTEGEGANEKVVEVRLVGKKKKNK